MSPGSRPLAAEAAGTFLLVLIGPGAVMVDASSGGALGRFGVATAFGLAVFTAVLLFGNVSGAHINPAVSIGLAAAGRFPPARVPAYVLAQCVGAVAAAFVLRFALGEVAHVGATLPAVPVATALAIEFLLSLILMAAVLAAGARRGPPRLVVAVLLGWVVGACAYLGGPATGASMNPARSLGPAIASGLADYHWIYWLAPVCGMLVAVLLLVLPRRSAS